MDSPQPPIGGGAEVLSPQGWGLGGETLLLFTTDLGLL